MRERRLRTVGVLQVPAGARACDPGPRGAGGAGRPPAWPSPPHPTSAATTLTAKGMSNAIAVLAAA
ncbi:hypothetical protein, partial [Streptomyces mirabilis]|uniref:hypothetical protein n=1 Tax=Streptomyces mirabilis TaxID=68239 RepID=UPI0036995399